MADLAREACHAYSTGEATKQHACRSALAKVNLRRISALSDRRLFLAVAGCLIRSQARADSLGSLPVCALFVGRRGAESGREPCTRQ